MGSAKELILGQLGAGQYLIDQFVADLSDQEFFKPPVPGANHAGWILGHVAVSEDSLGAAATGSPKRIAEDLQTLFSGTSECHPGPGKYPPRNEIVELFRNTRAHIVEALKGFDDARWDKPAPEGYPKELFPTLGSIWGLQGTHQFWHIGQLCVCRQALKKKRVLTDGN
jgi:hypothetical protein